MEFLKEFMKNHSVIITFVFGVFVFSLITGEYEPFIGSVLGACIGAITVLLMKSYKENRK